MTKAIETRGASKDFWAMLEKKYPLEIGEGGGDPRLQVCPICGYDNGERVSGCGKCCYSFTN